MNKLYLLGALIVFTPLLFFGFLGIQSQQGKAAGLVGNMLQACPNTPNCVCSESKVPDEHFIEPLTHVDLPAQAVMEKAQQIIIQMGGTITSITSSSSTATAKADSNYLSATFTSQLFRYVDDLELRFDPTEKVLHFRSASRVGKSDFGVNRERVETIKNLFKG